MGVRQDRRGADQEGHHATDQVRSLPMKLSHELAIKVINVIDAGLTSGLGRAEPGHMCIEAAVCYALGEPHNDKPSCVSPVVRSLKIRLNDSGCWHSNQSRAQGLRRLGIA